MPKSQTLREEGTESNGSTPPETAGLPKLSSKQSGFFHLGWIPEQKGGDNACLTGLLPAPIPQTETPRIPTKLLTRVLCINK